MGFAAGGKMRQEIYETPPTAPGLTSRRNSVGRL
jgi:hypothetical protein